MSNILKKDYISKETTQQIEFLKKYPNYDGRDILIAILDSGVDVSYAGMQKTSTGLPKVIDCFDFTDFGNVDTHVVRESNDKNEILGLSGRLLKIPSDWVNPSGKWHLGLKSIYELCSKAALEAIIKKRKDFIVQQNEIIKENIENINDDDNNKSMLEYLQMTESLSHDSLVADCIVWFNDKKWHACIDTSFFGDLQKKDVKVLTDFCDKYEYGTVWNIFSYYIKVQNDGNLLQIFTAALEHGTRVAHIAAACFPNEPERNGLAPGAQLVSMNVLDAKDENRLNYGALKKAFQKCIEMKVDIVNCSFGCKSKDFENQIKEMTEKYGIIIIQSAGNEGPFYFSVPKNISYFPTIFFIGSVSTKKLENQTISYKISIYSSKGPNSFGGQGITFVAPGEAYVPKHDSIKSNEVERISGTSFAAPNFAGLIACLITALKDNSIKYSPTLIKFVLSKTAILPKDRNALEFGHGIIQICEAFDFVKKCYDFYKKDYFYSCKLKISGGNDENNNNHGDGILIMLDSRKKFTYNIEILNNNSKIVKNLKIASKIENFIEISKFQKNSFKLKLDTNILEEGTINYAEICGINSNFTEFGNIFRLPITVVVPRKITKADNYRIHRNITIKPGTANQYFILAPPRSFQCSVKITALENIPSQILIYFGIDGTNAVDEKKIWQNFDETNQIQQNYFNVERDKIHELVIILPSSTPKELSYKVEMEFYGIHVKKHKPENALKKDKNAMAFYNYFKTLNASLFVKINKVSYNLVPKDVCNDTVMNFNDINSTEYLRISYNFTITKETKCSFKMNNKKHFAVFRVQVFTESKKYVCGFVTFLKEPVTLIAGTYLIIAFVSPFDSSTTTTFNNQLPPIEDLPSITVTMEIYEAFKPNIYSSSNINSKYTDKKPINLNKNAKHRIYFKRIPFQKLPSPLPSVIQFHGTLNLQNQNLQLQIPISHTFSFFNRKQKNSLVSKFEEKCLSENEYSNEMNEMNQKISETNLKIKIPAENMIKLRKNVISEDFVQIKKAFMKENFGIALLCLNKIRIKNQTNPNFGFINLIIIEVLKYLKWDHLIEAHHNSFLHWHRNYCSCCNKLL